MEMKDSTMHSDDRLCTVDVIENGATMPKTISLWKVENRKSDEEVSKVVEKSGLFPKIKELGLRVRTENVSQTNTEKKTVKPGIAKIEFVKPKKQEKTARKNVKQVPQPSDPTGSVADEAVHKELGDSLVRAATTAFSLEAEQDSGNITKTRSKATPNESSSLGITSGGGPRCQETIGDTIAQTRLLDLEKTKTSQHNEIASLKRRVKKLKKKNRSRTHKLKRLYKVGLTARVESSDDEESLDEDASKRRRINAIDADEEITLVSVADDIVSAASAAITVNSATTITATINTVDDIILAQALEEMKSTKPKKKRIVIQELGEDASKSGRINAIECREEITRLVGGFDKPNVQAQRFEALIQENAKKQKVEDDKEIVDLKQCLEIIPDEEENMEGYKLNDLKLKEFDSIQEMFDRAFKRVNKFKDFRTKLVEGKEKRAGTELAQEITKKQKSPSIVDWKIHKERRKSYCQIIRADGKSQMYMIFSHMLKSFDREDLETLYRLVKAKYESTRPMEDLDLVLWNDLKIMFEPHIEDNVWKNQQDYKVLSWKLYESCGVHFLRMQHMLIYILVEKKYPLTPSTLTMMLKKKLMIDYESEMAYQLLKFIIKQLKK
ncbi:hypothetical protein Tco_1273540 [Tanacetum coccineum]